MTFSLVWMITVIAAGLCASMGSMPSLLPFSSCMFTFQLATAVAFAVGVFYYDPDGVLGK